ncbi:hypothetical protein C7434_1215 [Pantoea sp. PNA 14-12]|nr:hypothetical protein C7434_1215 [Pantoea sp. PNA 14-12]WHT00740.1 MAG: hypothetical protein LZT29_03820 [Pantoea stewartii]
MIGCCACCGLALNRGLPKVKNNVEYKSCPKCSVTHGRQHIYFQTPNHFGTTPARETINNPQGLQSYCESCRPASEKDNPSRVFQHGLTCHHFE